MIRLMLFSSLVYFLSACAFHTGQLQQSSFLGKKVTVVDYAIGRSSTVHVFGIGGNSRMGLVSDARRDMISKFPLKKGQTFENTCVDFKTFFFWPVVKRTASVTADVVMDESQMSEVNYDPGYKYFFNPPDTSRLNGYSAGDSIIIFRGEFLRPYFGKLIGSTNKKVFYYLINEFKELTIKTKRINKSYMFSTKLMVSNDSKITFSVGQKVGFRSDFNDGFEGKGKIIGLNPKFALLESNSKYFVKKIASLLGGQGASDK